jgi:hypothetical protein
VLGLNQINVGIACAKHLIGAFQRHYDKRNSTAVLVDTVSKIFPVGGIAGFLYEDIIGLPINLGTQFFCSLS